MTSTPTSFRPAERGYLLVALMIFVSIMFIMLTVAARSWTFVVRRDAEAELIFRGEQYAKAIDFYRKETNAFPLELKILAQEGPHRHRFIRKLYKDPLAKDGKWGHLYLSPTGKGFINPYASQQVGNQAFLPGSLGENSGPLGVVNPGQRGSSGLGGRSRGLGRGRSNPFEEDEQEKGKSGYSELTSSEFEARGGEMLGLPIVGVVHRKREGGVKVYRNMASLNDWAFSVLAEGEQQKLGGATVGGRISPVGGGVGDLSNPIRRGGAVKDPGYLNPLIQRERDRIKQREEELRRAEEEGEEVEDESPTERPRYRQQPPPPDDEGEGSGEDEGDTEAPPGDPNAPRDPNAPPDPNAPADPNAGSRF